MAKTRIERIHALAELERLGVVFEAQGSDEIRCCCPAHDDDSPSVQMNVIKNLWNCKATHCGVTGDIVSYIALTLGVERGVVLIDLGTRYDLVDEKTINPEVVERFHKAIWDSGPLIQALYDRGLTDPMIRKARIGYHVNGGRITIPVWNAHKQVVNIRRYLPGAPGNKKFQNTRGYGTPARIYRIEDLLTYENVWICGGELKALVVGELLYDHKIGAIAASSGEGTWLAEWSAQTKGKNVWICMDIDDAGMIGARNVARLVCAHANSVRIVKLPLNKDKYPKGDVNDYIGKEEATAEDLLELMKLAKIYESETPKEEKPVEAIKVSLLQTTHPSSIGKRLQFNAVISAMDRSPYLIPKQVGVSCDRHQNNCAVCPIYTTELDANKGFVEQTIGSCSLGLMEMINVPTKNQKPAIQQALGIPECKSVGFHVKGHYKIQDARLVPQLTISGQGAANVTQSAYLVDRSVELNTPYEFDGTVHPHPATQQATLILDGSEIAQDSLLSFEPTQSEIAELTCFRAASWTIESLETKLSEIYKDLEHNVTLIFGRRKIQMTLDLTYHSPILFKLDKRQIPGWVNTLIAGDSAQGKSETALRLMEHYGLGERVECKNATVAGLLGGLQQMGTRWFVSWGVIPTHDKRLVILDEVKGASVEVLAKLTDMRSSGIAEIPKIERRQAHARTRLVFISNPRTNRQIASYNFGVEAIKELIGSLEDIRRFDLAIIVGADEVPMKVINDALTMESEIPHVYTSDLCRRLVLYAWTRTEEQVSFEPECRSALLDSTTKLCESFSEAMPLVDRGSIRYKVARLAAALAARTFSTNEDYTVLIVRKCHIDYIHKFLTEVYSDPLFGYLDFSRAQLEANKLNDPEVVTKHLLGMKHPADLVKQLLYREQITTNDFMDWCAIDKDLAADIVSLLTRKHAMHRQKRFYIKTAAFIKLLKEMEAGGLPEKAQVSKGEEM